MAKIINPSVKPITLPTGHIVPRLGELVTTNTVLRMIDNARALEGLTKSGEITVEFDEDPPFDGVYASTSLEPPPEMPVFPPAEVPAAVPDAPAEDPPADPSGEAPSAP